MFYPRWLADKACVVVQQERVLTLSTAAQAYGVQAGMRIASVRLLAPQSAIYVRDTALEQQALQACALAMLQYTPQVAYSDAAGLVLEVGAGLRLFGGLRQLCRLVRQSIQMQGFSLRLACAPNPSAAALLARAPKPRRILQARHLPTTLDKLPCSLLPEARAFQQWLLGIACYRLGQLQQLPRPGLQRRCGVAMLQALDHLYGKKTNVPPLVTAPASFFAHCDLFDRVDQALALLHAAQALLQQLCGWLQARQLAVQGIQLSLEHERGRAACAPTMLEILLGQACWQEAHLLRVLRERLARLELPAVVIGLRLQALGVQPRLAQSDDLFITHASGGNDFPALLDLLCARLGAENVLQAAPLADHRPEQANHWQSVAAATTGLALRVLSAPTALPRPLWLLPQPQPLRMQGERPWYGGVLHPISAVERIEAGWFAKQDCAEFVARDYVVAQHSSGLHYWLYRARASSMSEATPTSAYWYLHGLFA